ncbi:ATP-binding cassette domain-containing protein [Candidatus Vampirococcus lugosii]|uniref:Multidrug ABC transporter ATP-binding protein n=1 Tax=Candidatus Vampirococcus lugosii TaxID=2789015 RepID=A0ABS5QLM9_9BACT|nr:ATP-binding cassette domain-containing protein [Candidatus Vampirococcus lugosii]MBS8122102.1 multidrug ABC transporter ATP-binding protein [Candidatus Vampirococcus lugosii]
MKTVLEIKELEKSFNNNFKKVKVLNGVNIVVGKGQVYGFLGPNGSGKTTTLKCILGFLKYDSGTVSIFEQNPNQNNSIFKDIGYAPENAYFYDHLNGIEFLIFMGELSGLSKQKSELNGINLLDKL